MKQLKLMILISIVFMPFGVAQADFLTTAFATNNEQSGNMFDVVTLDGPLTVTGFDLNIDSSTETVEIYAIAGTHVGSETNGAVWTLIDTITGVVGAGLNSPTFIDVADFLLPGLSTTGLYITLSTGTQMNYTNGTALGSVFSANADLQILEGVGISYAFGITFAPRVWSGTIYYNKASQVPEPGTLALLGLGLAGMGMTRRKKKV